MVENMVTRAENKANVALNLKRAFLNFIYTPFFAATISLVAFFFWSINGGIFAIAAFAVVAITILFLSEDITPLIPLAFNALFTVRDLSTLNLTSGLIIFMPVAAALIIHFVIYRVKKVCFGKLLFPFGLVLASFLLGGIFNPESFKNYELGTEQIVCIGFIMPFAYFVLSQGIIPPKGVDVRNYLCYALVFTSFNVELQMLRNAIKPIYLGWGNPVFAGYVMLLAIPASLYLITKSKNPLPNMFISFALYVCMLLTVSDCSKILAFFCAPFLIYVTYKNCNYKYKKLLSFIVKTAIFAALIVAVILVISDPQKWSDYIFIHISDNGRGNIYDKSVYPIISHPLFGAGLYYPIFYDICGKNFHSFVLHSLATTGIFGLICHSFLLGKRLKILASKKDLFSFYMFFAVLTYDAFSLVDCGEFVTVILLVNVITLIAEILPEESDGFLPLERAVLKYAPL